MNIFEITIQEGNGSSWQVETELTRVNDQLQVHHDGELQLSQADRTQLNSLKIQRQQYGEFLGKALFQGEIHEAYLQALDSSSQGIRVFLSVEDRELGTLYWHWICAPRDWNSISLNQRCCFSISLKSSTERIFPLIPQSDLKALILAASPQDLEDFSFATFDVQQTVDSLKTALGEIQTDVLAVDVGLGMPTLNQLCDRLTQTSYHLLHIVGHGQVNRQGETVIYWATENNQVEAITGSYLIQRLQNITQLPHFVFLSACESAKLEAEMALGGLAQRLVQELGIPAVLAMTEKVTIKTAALLSKAFYPRLKEHGEVDRALVEATSSLSRHDILVPALFSRLGSRSLLRLESSVSANLNQQESKLAEQMRGWFEALKYDFESYQVAGEDYFEWIINIPARRGFDRILVRGIEGEAGLDDLQAVRQSVDQQRTDEGWLVSYRRISRAARDEAEKREYRDLFCYTFDELLDEVADFDGYFNWLEHQVKSRNIDKNYVPLACTKEEIDPQTKQQLGISRYDERDGWIEGYIDLWLDDPAKEHLSVLGEFGTGKTWFAFHYAWVALKKYLTAKNRGVERPRLPLVIPLRDYAKAVSVESLFSEFFFRKHEIKLPGYSAFEQLNRMGKLLLIFDGFDEMAARVDRQAMINNFWELAKVVVPGSKAILTCRTEHFPEAKEGRSLLNAELKASTANLTGETPQFEVLELEKFNDEQIQQVLSFRTTAETVNEVMGNPQLLDLARRPVMVELILAALPDIEAGKPVDISRVYLYAVRQKMERDIKNERTFTSLADKLYFLCELAWEMLSTEQMSLNYRSFPEQIRRIFATEVQEEKNLDHWDADMRSQTMLIRNSEGDYMPAHRSLLEFFVAYKLVAELGVLANDFTEVAQERGCIDVQLPPQNYTWQTYFQRQSDANLAPLNTFDSEPLEILSTRLRDTPLAKAVLDLAIPMLNSNIVRERLLTLIQASRGQPESDVGYLAGNLVKLLIGYHPRSLEQSDLSNTVIKDVNFSNISLRGTNFSQAMLTDCVFNRVLECVFSVAFSPDGKFLAVGDESIGMVQVWDMETLRIILVLRGHLSHVRSVAFSPDGQTLATGSDDKTVKVWRLDDGHCLATLEGHSNWVHSVAFSPDGETLVSGSIDHTIKVWRLSDSHCLTTLEGHSSEVFSVAFSPNGEILASSSSDHTIKLWRPGDSHCLATLEGHSSDVFSVAFSPNGEVLVSGSFDQTIRLWNVSNGECFATLKGHSARVLSVSFSPDGETLASGSSDNTIRLWSVSNGHCLATLEGHLAEILCVAFSPDRYTLVSGADDNAIKLWSVSDGNCLATLVGHYAVRSIAFAPDGETLASGSSDNTIRLWRPSDGHCFGTLEGHSDGVSSVMFSPNGAILASGSDDHTVKLWRLSDGNCFATLEGHSMEIRSVAFSPDGETLASGSRDNTIKLWRLSDGQCLNTLVGHSHWVHSIAFSPNGETLASSSADTTIKLWRLSDGQCLNTLEGHLDWANSAAFSPDGKTLASGSFDHTIKLWRLSDAKCLTTLKGYSDEICSIAFSPNGQILASGSCNHTVKLWRLSDGHCLNTLEGHLNIVNSVAFSPDGQTLASSSWDDTIRFWDVQTGECLRVITDKIYLGLNLTGVKGLTEVEIATLKALGAVEA